MLATRLDRSLVITLLSGEHDGLVGFKMKHFLRGYEYWKPVAHTGMLLL